MLVNPCAPIGYHDRFDRQEFTDARSRYPASARHDIRRAAGCGATRRRSAARSGRGGAEAPRRRAGSARPRRGCAGTRAGGIDTRAHLPAGGGTGAAARALCARRRLGDRLARLARSAVPHTRAIAARSTRRGRVPLRARTRLSGRPRRLRSRMAVGARPRRELRGGRRTLRGRRRQLGRKPRRSIDAAAARVARPAAPIAAAALPCARRDLLARLVPRVRDRIQPCRRTDGLVLGRLSRRGGSGSAGALAACGARALRAGTRRRRNRRSGRPARRRTRLCAKARRGRRAGAGHPLRGNDPRLPALDRRGGRRTALDRRDRRRDARSSRTPAA